MQKFDHSGEVVFVSADTGPGLTTPLPVSLIERIAPLTSKVYIESLTAQNLEDPNGTDQLSIAIYRNGVQVWPEGGNFLQLLEMAAVKNVYPVGIVLGGGRIQVMAKNISGSITAIGASPAAIIFKVRASWQAKLID